jgi:hypothetical protein
MNDIGVILLNDEIILPSGETKHLSPEESKQISTFLISDMKFSITKNQITEYIMNHNDLFGDFYIAVDPEKEYFLSSGNNLVYIWLNQTGFYSETQVFSFFMFDEKTSYLIRTRQQNIYNQNHDNTIFNETVQPQIFRLSNNSSQTKNLTTTQIKNRESKIINGQFEESRKIIDAKFQGTWLGKINVNNDVHERVMELKFEIQNAEVKLYIKYNDDIFQKYNHIIDYHDYCGNNFIYVIIYKAGNRTYIDTYSLALINEKEICVTYSRNSNETNDNNIKYLLGKGKLNKEK